MDSKVAMTTSLRDALGLHDVRRRWLEEAVMYVSLYYVLVMYMYISSDNASNARRRRDGFEFLENVTSVFTRFRFFPGGFGFSKISFSNFSK